MQITARRFLQFRRRWVLAAIASSGALLSHGEAASEGPIFVPPVVEPKSIVIHSADPSTPDIPGANQGIHRKFWPEITFEAPAKHVLTLVRKHIPANGKQGGFLPASSHKVFENGMPDGDIAGKSVELKKDELKSFTVKLEPSGLRAGEYSGQLRFGSTLEDGDGKKVGGVFDLPLTVKIRHGALWPLVTILVGLFLGWGLSFYRVNRLPIDQLLIEIANVRELANDEGFGKGDPKYEEFDSALTKGRKALALGRLQAARTELKKAQDILIEVRPDNRESLSSNFERGVELNVPGSSRTRWAGYAVPTFKIVSYAIVLALLGYTGFSELYMDDLVFGDDGIEDYVSLLAWGFGVQLTTASVTTWAGNFLPTGSVIPRSGVS
ncbi:hypothetical protein MJD09_04415 [bacterium]|nr:hypothetical protein [bacterium]